MSPLEASHWSRHRCWGKTHGQQLGICSAQGGREWRCDSEAAIDATASAFSFARGIAANTHAFEAVVAEALVPRKRKRRPG
jgi:hypothetical protein